MVNPQWCATSRSRAVRHHVDMTDGHSGCDTAPEDPPRAASPPTVAPPPAASALPGLAAPALPVSTPVSRRIRGIDMARALAIIGMVMVHFGPFEVDVDDPAGFLYETSHGRASILFIVLAGVGVSLLGGDRSPHRLRGATARLLFRAAVLFPLGVALVALSTRVAVILQYYAVYFLIAVVAVRWRDGWLLGGALAMTLIGPFIYLAGWFAVPGWYELPGQSDFSDLPRLFRDVVLTGYYPAVVWSAPLLFGMWLGRRDLRAGRLRGAMFVGGVTAAAAAYVLADTLTDRFGAPPETAASWRWFAVAEPHSEMPLWLLSATGVAVAILAASLVAADLLPRVTWPLVASGQLALTTYVGHLLVLWRYPQWLVRDDVIAAWVSVARFAVVAVALAALWRAVFPRGPLEWLLHLPFQRSARAERSVSPQPGP